ncbi:hypothetical protein AVEN_53396-1 [Araneus ventricosus]|uniref:Uncharacterized protein n=1 Tax=Araneus ventricosus TaxID=182803 RepID=A0A4Y2AAV5_ARAVE|nr:hypothetical protein AVEN_53396-1 [Araneus ventricosus]
MSLYASGYAESRQSGERLKSWIDCDAAILYQPSFFPAPCEKRYGLVMLDYRVSRQYGGKKGVFFFFSKVSAKRCIEDRRLANLQKGIKFGKRMQKCNSNGFLLSAKAFGRCLLVSSSLFSM